MVVSWSYVFLSLMELGPIHCEADSIWNQVPYIEPGPMQYNIGKMGERRERWRAAGPIFIDLT